MEASLLFVITQICVTPSLDINLSISTNVISLVQLLKDGCFVYLRPMSAKKNMASRLSKRTYISYSVQILKYILLNENKFNSSNQY